VIPPAGNPSVRQDAGAGPASIIQHLRRLTNMCSITILSKGRIFVHSIFCRLLDDSEIRVGENARIEGCRRRMVGGRNRSVK
jgi:hypothetical protein